MATAETKEQQDKASESEKTDAFVRSLYDAAKLDYRAEIIPKLERLERAVAEVDRKIRETEVLVENETVKDTYFDDPRKMALLGMACGAVMTMLGFVFGVVSAKK